MVWVFLCIVIAIICFALFIGAINSGSKSKETIPPFIPPRLHDNSQPEPAQQNPARHFFDRDPGFVDFSYLDPSEARRELNERKRDGEYLDFDEYGGYMNVIHSGRDDYWVDKIEGMTPEKVFNWYVKRKDEGKWTTPAIFDAIAMKLKPFHEQYLLDAMESITQGRIDGWVNARKKEGYFFSELAYEKAEKIFTGEIDNRKKRIRKPKEEWNPETAAT